VVIRIRDDGPGIPEAALDQVRAVLPRGGFAQPRHGRAGLGLSIARDIAQAHGGSVVLRISRRADWK